MGQGEGRRAGTGVRGMDEILGGGLLRGRCYLISGAPGVGKTTLGLQFLLEGVRAGERSLYLGLDVNRNDLLDIGRSHRWSLDGVTLQVEEDESGAPSTQTIFSDVDLALTERMNTLARAVQQNAPSRVVLDSIGALRSLSRQAANFHHEMKRFSAQLKRSRCTALLLDDEDGGAALDVVADGTIALDQRLRGYGGAHRRVYVKRVVGAMFREGYHDYRIVKGGLVVYPRLIASHYRHERRAETASTGIPALDELLGGGLDRGASLLLLGPTGTGKSSLAARMAVAAAGRGEKVVMYLFDESAHSSLVRADALGMSLRPHIKEGRIEIAVLEPGEWTLGQFADAIRRAVEDAHAAVVVIDSLHGYRRAMLDEPFATQQLREVISYLREQGVVTLLVAPQHSAGVAGEGEGESELGYLEDTALLFRRYERAGEARLGLLVLKRRTQSHRTALYDLVLGPPGGIALTPLAQSSAAGQGP